MTDELTQEQKDVMLDRIPLGRMGEAEELPPRWFLCSIKRVTSPAKPCK